MIMRKYSILFVTGVVLSLLSAILSSCKKNHETPVKPKLSFSETTKTVKESDGTIDITMTLDQPAPEATTARPATQKGRTSAACHTALWLGMSWKTPLASSRHVGVQEFGGKAAGKWLPFN